MLSLATDDDVPSAYDEVRQSDRAESARRVLRWLTPVLMVSLVVFSLLPMRPRATLHGTPGHVVLHVAGFGLLSLASLLLIVERAQEWIGVAALWCFAFGLEWMQHLVFRLHIEWADVLLDCAGTLLAFAAIRCGPTLYRTISPKV